MLHIHTQHSCLKNQKLPGCASTYTKTKNKKQKKIEKFEQECEVGL